MFDRDKLRDLLDDIIENIESLDGDGVFECSDYDFLNELIYSLSTAIDGEYNQLEQKRAKGEIIVLPLPIGDTCFYSYSYAENDNTVTEGVQEAKLTGYINENGNEFYTVIEEGGCTSDIPADELFATEYEALKLLKARQTHENINN